MVNHLDRLRTLLMERRLFLMEAARHPDSYTTKHVVPEWRDDVEALEWAIKESDEWWARMEYLFAALPFPIRHQWGGDAREFVQGLDVARGPR